MEDQFTCKTFTTTKEVTEWLAEISKKYIIVQWQVVAVPGLPLHFTCFIQVR